MSTNPEFKERPEEDEYTVFERARIIGARAMQIAQGAPLHVKLSEEELEAIHYNPVRIAMREFEAGKMPIAVKRPSPDR